jgi:hypothetical protein
MLKKLFIKKMIFRIFFYSYKNFFKYASTIFLLKKSDYKAYINNLTNIKEKTDFVDFDEEWILCNICKNKITKISDKIEVNSKHNHTFLNPQGLFFNISCFKNAPGCETFSRPTEEYTWFPGYEWQVVVCKNCRIHNGWKYTSGENAFFGLIENTLNIKIE